MGLNATKFHMEPNVPKYLNHMQDIIYYMALKY